MGDDSPCINKLLGLFMPEKPSFLLSESLLDLGFLKNSVGSLRKYKVSVTSFREQSLLTRHC